MTCEPKGWLLSKQNNCVNSVQNAQWLYSQIYLYDVNHAPKIFTRSAALVFIAAIVRKNGKALLAEPKKVNQQEPSSQDPNHLLSQPLPSTARNKLSILQWIPTKMPRHADKFISWCMYCPSKLLKNHKTPFIKGSAIIRKDQKELNGCFSSETTWPSKKLLSTEQAGLEIHTIRIQT